MPRAPNGRQRGYVESVESADYNAAPTKRAPTVLTSTPRGGDDQARQLRLLQWGLVPFWAKDPKVGNKDDQRPRRDRA